MTLHSITITKDSMEYEIDMEVDYPAGRSAGVRVNYASVTRLKDMHDIDPDVFFDSLTEEEKAQVEKEADDLAWDYKTTDWT